MSEGTIAEVLHGDAQWCVVHADCRAILPAIPDASVDAIVCDPPYELAFMGRRWDANGIAFDVAMWSECLRVLKPGGHLLAFGGSRTSHRLVCAIEDAGFEIRDAITWIYSTGFPKSVNIERMVAMQECELPGRHFASTLPRGKKAQPGDHLCPETESSRAWKGRGTALKPASEPICVARKPLAGTMAANVLAHGTGALDIDGCRVASGVDHAEKCGSVVGLSSNRNGQCYGEWDGERGDSYNSAGRWPPNVVFSHHPDCVRIGTAEVKAAPTWDTPNRDTEPSAFTGSRVSKVRHGRAGEASAERTYSGVGGTKFGMTPGPRRDVEDVDVWQCVDGCPVKALGEMSGESFSPPVGSTTKCTRPASAHTVSMPPLERGNGHGDAGTAARFFPQFAADGVDSLPFRYQAKAARAEKDAGCEHFRTRSGAEATDSEDGQARLASPRTGAGRTGGARNIHPTSKPIELIRWLTRLVARPGQVVLCPFGGAGSEGVAARLEGCRWIGIELNDSDEEPFVSLARARLSWVDGREFIPRASLRGESRGTQVGLFAAHGGELSSGGSIE